MTMQCKILWPLDIQGLNIQLWEDSGSGFSEVFNYSPYSSNVDGYYIDAGSTSTGYVNLLDTLAEEGTTLGVNTYEFQAADTTFGRADFRLKLVRTSGTSAFQLRTTDWTGSILEMLGAPTAADLTDVSGEIVFPNTYKGSWLLPKDYNYHDFRKYPRMVAGVSSTSANKVFVRSRKKSDFRNFMFLAVPGALAYEGRTVFQNLVDQVPGVGLGDIDISFETFWRECISVGSRFRFYYGVDTSVIEQPTAGRSEMIVTAPNMVLDPSDHIVEKYKERGIDYVDIAFQADVLEDTKPVTAGVPPAPSFTIADTGVKTIAVDASASTVTGAAVYTWSWGDGSPDTTGVTATKVYTTSAVYVITLSITDANGSASLVQTHLVNVDPTAGFTSTSTDLSYAVDASTSTDDIGIVLYSWDWDDGSETTTPTAAFTHVYPSAGTYNPVLTVTDALGGSDTATETVVISFTPPVIGEPATSLTYTHIWRCFEASDTGGLVDTIANTGTTGSDFLASGTARPAKSATGVGSVVFNGTTNEMTSGTAAEYEFMTDATSDWTVQMVFFADSALPLATQRLLATTTGTTRGIYVQVASGTLRFYGYGGGSDNSPFGGIVYDDTWQVLTLRFDKSAKDAYKWSDTANGFYYNKDSNWSWTPEAGSPDFKMYLGSGNGVNFADFAIRDLRIANGIGNVYADAVHYQNWALINGLLD